MIKTIVVAHISDGVNTYYTGDRVRIKMKPLDAKQPERAREYIGHIAHIADGQIFLITSISTRLLSVGNIDAMRFAEPDESFDNKWDF